MVLKISENPQIQTPVGQFAKRQIPTLKTPKLVPKTHILVDFSVGRQTSKISHALTHTRGKTQNHDFEFVNHCKNTTVDNLRSFVNLFSTSEKNKVVFHQQEYISSVISSYTAHKSIIFLDLVKVFTLLQKENRNQILEGIYETTDDDFLSALRLFKVSNQKPKIMKIMNTTEEIIWSEINRKYRNKAFTINELSDDLILEPSTIRYYLKGWVQTEFIIYAGKQKSISHYQLSDVQDPRFLVKKATAPAPQKTRNLGF